MVRYRDKSSCCCLSVRVLAIVVHVRGIRKFHVFDRCRPFRQKAAHVKDFLNKTSAAMQLMGQTNLTRCWLDRFPTMTCFWCSTNVFLFTQHVFGFLLLLQNVMTTSQTWYLTIKMYRCSGVRMKWYVIELNCWRVHFNFDLILKWHSCTNSF